MKNIKKMIAVLSVTVVCGLLFSQAASAEQNTRCVAINGPDSGGNNAPFCHVRKAESCEMVSECVLLRARYICSPDQYTPKYANCSFAYAESNCYILGCNWKKVWR